MLYDERMNEIADAIIAQIHLLMEEKERVIIAVDGRSASGKTTLTRYLKTKLDCNLIHMDDFFLLPKQRTKERRATPGENVDHERFLEEVMIPLEQGKPFAYRPFSCSTGTLAEPVEGVPKKITIVEGAYSCHKKLWDYYDLHIFITIDQQRQIQRIIKRNGEEKAKQFEALWIPFEERYIEAFDIENRCELRFEI